MTSYDTQVLTNASFYLKLDEASGAATAVDATGSGWDFNINGTPTLGSASVNPSGVSSYSFNGTNAFLNLAYNSGLMDGRTFTVCAWIKPAAIGALRCIASHDSSGAGWAFYVDSSGKLNAFFPGAGNSHLGTTVLAANTSYFVAMTVDATNTQTKLYINGSLDATIAVIPTATNPINQFRVGNSHGSNSSDATNNFFFSGLIDDVSFHHNVVLSATDISNLYTLGTNTPTAASGTASLTVSASGAAVGGATGAAALSLSASGAGAGTAAGSASLAFDASGTGTPPNGATGDANLTLSASGDVAAPVAGSASLTFTESGDTGASVSGSAHLALTASGNTGAPPTPYVAAVMADAPIGYWRLGEPSGDTATDSSGYGNDGTFTYQNARDVVHGVTSLVAADPDTATTLRTDSAGNPRMNAPAATTLAFTHEVWFVGEINIAWTGPGWSYTSVYTEVHSASPSAGNYIQVGIDAGTDSYSYLAYTSADVLNTLHHLAVTRDGTGVLSIYFDGQLLRQWSSSAAPRLDLTTTFEITPHHGSATFDELALYDYALSADRVAAHYTVGYGSHSGATLTLTATGTVTGASARGTATLTFGGLGQVPTPTAGIASLTLEANGVAVALFATDTSNNRHGRRRLGFATVTVTRPVAAPPDTLTLTTAYDKALALPSPDMVGGRAT